MAERSGYTQRCRLNGIVFKVVDMQIRGSVGKHETGHSEGLGFADRVRTQRTCEVTIKQASLDLEAFDPWSVVGIPLIEGLTIPFSGWATGDSDPIIEGAAWLIMSSTWTPDVTGGQPFEITLENQGEYRWDRGE